MRLVYAEGWEWERVRGSVAHFQSGKNFSDGLDISPSFENYLQYSKNKERRSFSKNSFTNLLKE